MSLHFCYFCCDFHRFLSITIAAQIKLTGDFAGFEIQE